ncbi:MAG: ABC transporter substrate-binding protein [Desulfobacterales bacterium]
MKCFAKIRLPGLVLVCLLWFFFLSASVRASEADAWQPERSISANLILSRNIRPYMEAAEAIRAALTESLKADIHVYELFRYQGKARETLASELAAKEPGSLCIAIGPEAAAFLWEAVNLPEAIKLYSIVLNPENVSPDIAPDCGVSLNIPPSVQLAAISRSLSDARRIGMFYDPKNNAEFFARAERAADLQGLRLVPLQVSAKKEIPDVFSAAIRELDAIWLIPDQTVVSESIAQYIIKQSILQGVPVVGYNQFFYNSGAAVAFVFDYAELGRQTARMAINRLQTGKCRYHIPDFEVWINQSVFKKLEIPPPVLDKPLMGGP